MEGKGLDSRGLRSENKIFPIVILSSSFYNWQFKLKHYKRTKFNLKKKN